MGKAVKEGPDSGLTKLDFIKSIASGETISSIEKAMGMKYNTLPSWVIKWGLKGINTNKAQSLLVELNPPAAPQSRESIPPGPPAAETAAVDPQSQDVDWAMVTAQIVEEHEHFMQAKDKEVEQLRAELAEAKQTASDITLNAGTIIPRLTEEKDQLIRERNEYRQLAKDLDIKFTNLEREYNHELVEWDSTNCNLQAHIGQLQAQLNECAPKIVIPAGLTRRTDSVAFYEDKGTAGFQFVEAIESVVSGMEGVRAFHLGSAIQTLWHLENEAELVKVQHHVERLFHSYL